MLIRRLWLDADGGPHAEEATLIAAPVGAGVSVPGGPLEIEGSPLSGPARVIAVSDPACGMGALGEGLDQLWTADLLEGARIVDRSEWEATIAERAAARAAALAALQGAG